jgi:hypothetical protein
MVTHDVTLGFESKLSLSIGGLETEFSIAVTYPRMVAIFWTGGNGLVFSRRIITRPVG